MWIRSIQRLEYVFYDEVQHKRKITESESWYYVSVEQHVYLQVNYKSQNQTNRVGCWSSIKQLYFFLSRSSRLIQITYFFSSSIRWFTLTLNNILLMTTSKFRGQTYNQQRVVEQHKPRELRMGMEGNLRSINQ